MDGSIRVQYRLLADKIEMSGPGYELVLPVQDVYRRGRLLSETFIDLFSTPGWTIARAAVLIQVYLQYLGALLEAYGYGGICLDRLNCGLPGSFIDATPQNIVIGSEGSPHLIDIEWRAHREIELGYLLFRGLALLSAFFQPLKEAPAISYKEFFESLFAAAGLPAGVNDVARYSAQEVQFQLEITGVG